jgi:hypothetical protein
MAAPSRANLSTKAVVAQREAIISQLKLHGQGIQGHKTVTSQSQPGTNPYYDVLVIGGGATGAGAALDAATRGLKVVCVEKEDFGSGTSSRSTKLIWGGSRYLVQALVNLFSMKSFSHPIKSIKDFRADFKMVLNCHRERRYRWYYICNPGPFTWNYLCSTDSC